MKITIHILFRATLAGWLFIQTLPLRAAPVPEWSIRQVKFSGNQYFSKAQLQRQMLTRPAPWYYWWRFWKKRPRFDESILQSDLLRLKSFYEAEGFLNPVIQHYQLTYHESKRQVTILIPIEAGIPTQIKQVDLVLEDSTLTLALLKRLETEMSLPPARRLRNELLLQDKQKLTAALSEIAYPYARIKNHISIQPNQHFAQVQYFIEAGPACVFGPIDLAGNTQVPDRVILRELGFKTNDIFQFSKLANAQRRLYQLQLFQFIRITPQWQERKPQIPIEIRLKEAKPLATRFGLGYATEEKLRVSIQIAHRNFLGDARSLNLDARYSSLGFDGALTLVQPYLFNERFDFTQKIFYTYENEITYNLTRFGGETTVSREFSRDLTGALSYRYETDAIDIRELATASAIAKLEGRQLYDKSNVSFALRYTHTDHPFSPQQGIIFYLRLDYAGVVLPAEFKYYKFYFDWRKYWPLKTSLVLAWRNAGGWLQPYGNSKLTPLEERFYAGGSNSMRGWRRRFLGPRDENNAPLGGQLLFENNLETRVTINSWFGTAVFLDLGNVWPEDHAFTWRSIQFAAGGGLRFITPIGPIRLDLAAPTPHLGQRSYYQIHLSIGQAF
ncbi:outer membrane protein assembly factor BamA [candidate division KSB1 bacterium]|nr:outer membrane protein assembly factor BamA [candidate division KSB1 bacterium]